MSTASAPTAARAARFALAALAAASISGCGRGGGDLDHPVTLDRMVQEAKAAPAAHPAAASRPPAEAAPAE